MPERVDAQTNEAGNFRINDLIFDVPPTDINISHRSTVFSDSHLRSRYVIKAKTGRSVAYIGLRLIVLPDEFWKLHRLVQQFKFTPFWEISNLYVRTTLVPDVNQAVSMAVCAQSMNIGTIADTPDTLQVDLTLAWFNYRPYSSNFTYKRDWAFKVGDKIRSIGDLEAEDVDEIQSPSGFPEFAPDQDEFLKKSKLMEYNDVTPSFVPTLPTQPVHANESNIYKHYCNLLQAKALEKDFLAFGSVDAVTDPEEVLISLAQLVRYPYRTFNPTPHVVFKWREFMRLSPSSNLYKLLSKAFPPTDFEPDNVGGGLLGGQIASDQVNATGTIVGPSGTEYEGVGTPLSVTGGKGRITSHIGRREPPTAGASSDHKGVDIGGFSEGVELFSPIEGEVVVRVERNASAGGFIIIKGTGKHEGLFSRHLHMESATLPLNRSRVDVGNSIGFVGTTKADRGVGTGIHQHYELWEGGVPLNKNSNLGGTPQLMDPEAVTPPLKAQIQPLLGQVADRSDSKSDKEGRESSAQLAASIQEELVGLEGQGWSVFRSSHIPPTLYRDRRLIVNNTDGHGQPLVAVGWGVELYNSFAYLPIVGHEYPTAQYMGGQDARIYLRIVDTNRTGQIDGLSAQGVKLLTMRKTLERNARTFRIIQDSWLAKVEFIGSRLIGEDSYVINSIRSNSIPNTPGSYEIMLELDACAEFQGLPLDRGGFDPDDTFAEVYKVLRRFIEVEKIQSRHQKPARVEGSDIIKVIDGESITRPIRRSTDGFSGWQVAYKNLVDKDEDPWLHSVVDLARRNLYLGSWALSDKFYGGYTPEEIVEKFQLYGVEEDLLPDFEGEGAKRTGWLRRHTEFLFDDFDSSFFSPNDTKFTLDQLKDLTFVKAGNLPYIFSKRIFTGVVTFGASAAVNSYQNRTAIVSDDGIPTLTDRVVAAQQQRVTTTDIEDQIVDRYREILSILFHQILQGAEDRDHPEFQDAIKLIRRSSFSSLGQAYPDLDLPDHPAFRDPKMTFPDFYFYNGSEDGQVDILDNSRPWEGQLETAVKNSWGAMKKFSTGDNEDIAGSDLVQSKMTSDASNFKKGKFQKNYRSKTNDLTAAHKEWIQIEADFIDPESGRLSMKKFPGLFGHEDNVDMVYGEEGVQQLAREAARDITDNQTFLMRRAFPTFKLYFIDEDDHNQGWRSLSDFYSYSAVRRITVTRSRKIPADLVIIELNNTAGVLDGTLANSITDVDYATRERKNGELTSKGKILADRSSTSKEGTPQDHLVEAIVLREGMNIQLRLGYSNNPEYLETVFNGRVVQVNWTENSDVVTIMAQSFATELIAIKKGVTGKKLDGDNVTEHKTLSYSIGYDDTTELLSEMLKSPEVLHFGKWEFGTIFQTGEASSPEATDDPPNYTRHIRLTAFGDAIQGDAAEIMQDIYASDIPGQGGSVERELFSPDESQLTNFSAAIEAIKKRFKRLKNNPVDDNIFAPHPQDYVDYGWTDFSGTIDKDEIKYYPVSTTIWEIFQEMCLRHPGWIALPVPYGRRMTMFFGVPSQRYWARDVPEVFVRRMNQLRNLIAKGLSNSGESPVDDFTLGDIITEYTNGLNLRFRPFRRYHLATSRTNIVANNIAASSYGVWNACSVSFTKNWKTDNSAESRLNNNRKGGSWRDTLEVRAHSQMPDEDVLLNAIDYFNTNGQPLAERYGQGCIIQGLKDMYKGSITLIGNPRLKPYDVIFIADEYNDLSGPIEVEEVTHIFTPEMGFISVVVPDAVVIANEVSSWPILVGMGSAIVLNKMATIAGHMADIITYPLTDVNISKNIASATGPGGGELSRLLGASQDQINAAVQGYESTQETSVIETYLNMRNYYFWLKRKVAVNVVPLIRGRRPLIAGLPEDLFDTSWDNFRGEAKATISNIAEGRFQRNLDAQIFGYRVANAYDENFNVIEKWALSRNIKPE